MQTLSFILRRIWCGWFFLTGFLSFLIFYPFFLLFLSREKWFPLAWRLKKVWAHIILFCSGIFYKIKSEGEVDKDKAYIICPNHASYLDIVLANIAFPNYFHFIAKAELQNIPLFNIFFKKMNIPVNRGSIKSSHKAFERAKEDLDKNISIAIFPEATIPECAPGLGPFKNGAFRLAIEKQTPVVPITFLDNWSIFPDSKGSRFLCRPGISRIIISAPIETKGMTDNDATLLKQKVHEIIAQNLKTHGCNKRVC
ncbi:MAG: lysophospholipid acyltransferase family protein [Bacteroidota bacterium]